MFLKEKYSGHLVEVIDTGELFDPEKLSLRGKYQIGEDDQDEEVFSKTNLEFMSGEALPRCWLN
ncbi:acetyltransferase [Aliikangiella coralliicola]|uniref:Acetyltransferase n=1 Tax=Aliikangiella coralliicola TaxID=2592383 RepID=A0A545UIG4_9GAMM|nr:acetyltransferase [Aliikangiella coralliicola]TQV89259.1 acetyltransferase [Aliikangiella coralliicola]